MDGTEPGRGAPAGRRPRVGSSLERALAWCGIAAPSTLLVATVALGAFRPGYSHAAQTISELAEVGTPLSGVAIVAAFLIPGALFAAFGLGTMRAFGTPQKPAWACLPLVLVGAGWFGAGVFPCGPCRSGDTLTFTTAVHFLFATIVEASIILAPLRMRRLGATATGWPAWFPAFSRVTGWLAFGLVAVMWLSFGDAGLAPYSGVLQRALFTLFFAWAALVALPLARGATSFAVGRTPRRRGAVDSNQNPPGPL